MSACFFFLPFSLSLSLSVVNMTGPDDVMISNGIKAINSVSSSDEGSYSCDISGTPGTYTGTLTIKRK